MLYSAPHARPSVQYKRHETLLDKGVHCLCGGVNGREMNNPFWVLAAGGSISQPLARHWDFMEDHFDIEAIGFVETPFNDLKNMPIQPLSGIGIKGKLIIREKYKDGLEDLDGFSHATLIYILHKVEDYALKVVPFMDHEEHGIFATRSPKRPNRIGISTVKIIEVKDNVVDIEDIDILNGTPIIDIKPYFPQFDNREHAKSGWLEKRVKLEEEKYHLRSDDRFVRKEK
jgi:tRNA-Thr(GGU) m(6)t(6)A37 methyltransferase TsaA